MQCKLETHLFYKLCFLLGVIDYISFHFSCLFRDLSNFAIYLSLVTFSAHKYHSRKDFLDDVEKILGNCILYNGKESPFTQKAESLVRVAKQTLEEVGIFNIISIQCIFHS